LVAIVAFCGNCVVLLAQDVLYTICNNCGPVQRIVIFRKNGVQAMVEFDSVPSAQRAKASLNGADIYSGCCTLKIEYAKVLEDQKTFCI